MNGEATGAAHQRLRASRGAHVVASFMTIAGGLGLAVSVTLAVWGFHVLSDPKAFPAGPASTANKLDFVAVVGVVPALISLLVIAAGILLQVKSIDLITGGASQSLVTDDEEEDLPEAGLQVASIDLVGIEVSENSNSDDKEGCRKSNWSGG